jgi:hypothetical protein
MRLRPDAAVVSRLPSRQERRTAETLPRSASTFAAPVKALFPGPSRKRLPKE